MPLPSQINSMDMTKSKASAFSRTTLLDIFNPLQVNIPSQPFPHRAFQKVVIK